MTLLAPQTGTIPGPHPSELTQPFWDACARGELLFQRCATCGLATHTPAFICAHCTSPELSWEVSAGTGSVYSWTTVWRPQTPAFVVPYQPASPAGYRAAAVEVSIRHTAAVRIAV